MATQVSGGASALPLDAALAILPSLPRPVLSRLVTRMIERLDEIDGDADCDEDDAEDAFGFSQLALGLMVDAGAGCLISDRAEEDDHGGGDVGDEGEAEDGRFISAYGIDQSLGPLPLHTH